MKHIHKHDSYARLLALPAAIITLALFSASAAFGDLEPPDGGPPYPGAHWCSYCQPVQGGAEVCDGKWCPHDKICGGTSYWDETTMPHTLIGVEAKCVDRPE